MWVEGFDDSGAIRALNYGDIVINDSVFLDNISAADRSGGALYAEYHDVTVTNSRFERNHADVHGGAIMAETVAVYDSHFVGNSASTEGNDVNRGNGGAMWAEYNAYSEDSTFTGNYAANEGGAIFVDSGSVGADYSSFTNNRADDDGGAIGAESGSVSLFDASFTGNTAGDRGGAIATVDADVYESVFVNNIAENDGGGAIYAGDDADIVLSVFESNEADGDGGAVYAGLDAFVEYSTFVDNVAYNGGAIFAVLDIDVETSTFHTNSANYTGGALNSYDGSLYVENSTFVDNTADSYGGALYADHYYVYVEYSTLVGNSAPDGAHVWADSVIETFGSVFAGAVGSDGCDAGAYLSSDGYNFDDDGTCSESSDVSSDDFGYEGDPLLGPLQDNGGHTQTMAPLPGSTLIDTHDDGGDCFTIQDQRDISRPQGAACDTGAVEALADISFVIPTAGGDVNVTVSNATCVDDVAGNLAAGYSTPPAGLVLPFGVLEYSFCVPNDGWTVGIAMTLPSPVTVLYKVQGPDWTQVDSAVIDGVTVYYEVTDGGELDEDGLANSYIIDPVGPGILAGFAG